jgi:hypothetical protein
MREVILGSKHYIINRMKSNLILKISNGALGTCIFFFLGVLLLFLVNPATATEINNE